MSVLPTAHVSHSQLTGWAERCQKAFQLQRIQGAPVVPAWWLVGGSTVHEVTEDLDRRGLEFGLTPADLNVTIEIEGLTESKLDELMKREQEKSGVPQEEWFTAGRGKGQGYDYWSENAPKMVANYLTWRTRTGWPIAFFGDLPGIEFDLNVTMEAGPIKGAPDRVFSLPNGELVVADIKSGSSTPKTVMQQGLYATLLAQEGHRRPKYGTFVKVKEDAGPGAVHTTLAPLAKYDERLFNLHFGALRAQVETGTFIPNVGDNCRTCGVSASCYAAGGSLSADYDPLDPNYKESK